MPTFVEGGLTKDEYHGRLGKNPLNEDNKGDELVIELGSKIEEMDKKLSHSPHMGKLTILGLVAMIALACATLGVAVSNGADISKVLDAEDAHAEPVATVSTVATSTKTETSSTTTSVVEVENTFLNTRTSSLFTSNVCEGSKPTDDAFNNFPCTEAVTNAVEQSGTNVTAGYVGAIDNSATPPITTTYRAAGLCPVNVHWHLGAEHLSNGEYDEHGSGPYDDYALDDHRRLDSERELAPERELAGGGVRQGYQCRKYDETDSKFTKPYTWNHCIDMTVGQTYEIHWPHSTVGACGTPYQYQTPFYDGVFCKLGDGSAVLSGAAKAQDNVGVQSQVFTVVNDESYYFPDLINGAVYTDTDTDDWWTDVAIYTGSTTGTSRDNEQCSAYSPITWQVDRKCHLISASSFDKLCADMKAQVDDMSDDLHAHGSRELVTNALSSAQELPT